jgi:hypothetical protein
MPKHRANGRRWPGMLQSSKERAKPVAIVFIGRFWFPAEVIADVVGSAPGFGRNSVQPAPATRHETRISPPRRCSPSAFVRSYLISYSMVMELP